MQNLMSRDDAESGRGLLKSVAERLPTVGLSQDFLTVFKKFTGLSPEAKERLKSRKLTQEELEGIDYVKKALRGEVTERPRNEEAEFEAFVDLARDVLTGRYKSKG